MNCHIFIHNPVILYVHVLVCSNMTFDKSITVVRSQNADMLHAHADHNVCVCVKE